MRIAITVLLTLGIVAGLGAAFHRPHWSHDGHRRCGSHGRASEPPAQPTVATPAPAR